MQARKPVQPPILLKKLAPPPPETVDPRTVSKIIPVVLKDKSTIFMLRTSAARLVRQGLGRFRRRNKLVVMRVDLAPRASNPDIYTPPPFDPIASCMSTKIARLERKRQVALATAAGSHTDDEWRDVVSKFGNRCLRCDASGADVQLTKDHIVPLSQNGTNYASNLQPLCLECNMWKGSREIDFRWSKLALSQ